MLGADVVVVEPARLVDRELDHLLGARREPDLADDRPIATADDELDGGADLVQLDAQVVEDLAATPSPSRTRPEQQMLGADVVVVEPLRLLLRERQDLARALRELVEIDPCRRMPVLVSPTSPWVGSHASTRLLPSDPVP